MQCATFCIRGKGSKNMYTYVCIYKKKQERVTPCSGWLSVGSGGEESGEDTISEISYVYLSV